MHCGYIKQVGVEVLAQPFAICYVFGMTRVFHGCQQIVVAPDSPAVFRRTSLPPGDTDGVEDVRIGWLCVLDLDLM